MNLQTSLGVSLASSIPPECLVDAYQLIERRGFSELWVHEDCFYHGGFSAAATALQATRTIPVGIGIVSALVRHPAVTAMEVATLARAHPGRLRVGIGVGALPWMKQLGVYPHSPRQALRETITSIRALLAGESLTQVGAFTYDHVRLEYPVANVPLYAGVLGPRNLALSAEVADGTVITVTAGPKYLETVRQITNDTRTKLGITRPHALPTLSYCFVDHDTRAARQAARRALAEMFARVGPDILTTVYGIDDALRRMIERGGAESLLAEMPEEWIDWFAAAGGPEQCLLRIRALTRAGATSVILTLTEQDRVTPSIELLAKHVLSQI